MKNLFFLLSFAFGFLISYIYFFFFDISVLPLCVASKMRAMKKVREAKFDLFVLILQQQCEKSAHSRLKTTLYIFCVCLFSSIVDVFYLKHKNWEKFNKKIFFVLCCKQLFSCGNIYTIFMSSIFMLCCVKKINLTMLSFFFNFDPLRKEQNKKKVLKKFCLQIALKDMWVNQ